MTVDALKASKLGKIIVKLVKEPPAPGERRFSVIHSTLASNGDIHTSAPALKRACLSYHNLSEKPHVSNNCLFVIVLPQRSRTWRRI